MFNEPNKIIGTPENDILFSQGRQIQSESCAVNAQCFVLNMFGIKIDEKQLIREGIENGIYSPKIGTVIDKVGNLLVRHGIEVNRYENATIGHLIAELAQGHKVIVGVDGSELLGSSPMERLNEKVQDIFLEQPNHALVVTAIELDRDNPMVIVTDPATGEPLHKYPVSQFCDAWKDGNYFMVATKEAPDINFEKNNIDKNSVFFKSGISFEQFLDMTQRTNNSIHGEESYGTNIEKLTFKNGEIQSEFVPNKEWTGAVINELGLHSSDNHKQIEKSLDNNAFREHDNNINQSREVEGDVVMESNNTNPHLGIGETDEGGMATLGGLGHLGGIGEIDEEGMATLGSLGHLGGIGEADDVGMAALGGLGHLGGIGETDDIGMATLGSLGHLGGIGETDDVGMATLGSLGHLGGIGETDDIGMAALGGLGHMGSIGDTENEEIASLGGLGHLGGIDEADCDNNFESHDPADTLPFSDFDI